MKSPVSVGEETPAKRSSAPATEASARGGVGTSIPDGFRRLAWSAFSAVFVLILLGGTVRVSDSGLGCGPAGSGTHGWPLCNGGFVPGNDINHILEYSHRVVATITSLLIAALTLWAWRSLRANTAVVRLTTAAAALVLFEAVLGGATVEYDLHELLVAIHLGTAMIIIALLLATARKASGDYVVGQWPVAIKRLAVATSVSVWATIVAGGYMSGTQAYGRADEAATVGARLACGAEFPGCLGGWFPFGKSSMTDVHLTHRFFMYITAILVVALVVQLIRHARQPGAEVRNLAIAAAATLGLQITLGVLNVLLDLSGWLIMAHLATGTILWILTVWLTINVSGRPQEHEAAANPN